MAAALRDETASILAANADDVQRARAAGTASHLIDRLSLDARRLEDMAKGIEAVAALPDPIGEVLERDTRPNGLQIERVRVPIGLIAVIYEARPNVTSDVAALCLKSGNAVILRGGSDAYASSRAIVDALRARSAPTSTRTRSARRATDRRERAGAADDKRPRGPRHPTRRRRPDRHGRPHRDGPYDETGVGNCHIYVESTADEEMAERSRQRKGSRPSVCNAAEGACGRPVRRLACCRLSARRYASAAWSCASTTRPAILATAPGQRERLGHGFLDLILPCGSWTDRRCDGSHHSLRQRPIPRRSTRTRRQASGSSARWIRGRVRERSTRFTDGYEMGLGAEIGISTQKMHARGPMGCASCAPTSGSCAATAR